MIYNKNIIIIFAAINQVAAFFMKQYKPKKYKYGGVVERGDEEKKKTMDSPNAYNAVKRSNINLSKMPTNGVGSLLEMGQGSQMTEEELKNYIEYKNQNNPAYRIGQTIGNMKNKKYELKYSK